MNIEKLLRFIKNDTAEAMDYLTSENLEMVYRLCECIMEQAAEIKQLISNREKGK